VHLNLSNPLLTPKPDQIYGAALGEDVLQAASTVIRDFLPVLVLVPDFLIWRMHHAQIFHTLGNGALGGDGWKVQEGCGET
jgi:hypothetical protein